jgi:hypothetical protein
MSLPSLYIDTQLNVSMRVDDMFRAVLAPDVIANIARCMASYSALNDSFDFVFERHADALQAVLRIRRYKFCDFSEEGCLAALLSEPEQIAKLILFLA